MLTPEEKAEAKKGVIVVVNGGVCWGNSDEGL